MEKTFFFYARGDRIEVSGLRIGYASAYVIYKELQNFLAKTYPDKKLIINRFNRIE